MGTTTTTTTTMFIALIAVCLGTCLAANDAAWESYKTKFGKVYGVEEDAVRYAQWKATVSEVHLHNTQYANVAGYSQGINQFADMSQEEFKKTMLTLKVPKDRKKGQRFVPTNDPIPKIVDCSGKYGNQGCGGGWYGAAWDYIRDCGGNEG